jgi:predicted transcriptional regulator
LLPHRLACSASIGGDVEIKLNPLQGIAWTQDALTDTASFSVEPEKLETCAASRGLPASLAKLDITKTDGVFFSFLDGYLIDTKK